MTKTEHDSFGDSPGAASRYCAQLLITPLKKGAGPAFIYISKMTSKLSNYAELNCLK